MSSPSQPKWPWLLARFGVSASVLAVVARTLDLDAVVERLSGFSLGWVALGLGLSVLQVVMLGWRWRFTAARLDIDLPMGIAVREYYLGIFLNQLLPGGVTGDVSRAWRHARTEAPTGPSVRAVVLERMSGQVIMTIFAAGAVLMLPLGPALGRVMAVLGTVGIAAVVVVTMIRRAEPRPFVGRIWADTHRAVLAPEALPIQVGTALLTVASYVGLYLVAARAVGVETELLRFLPLVPPVLMTMLVPISVAGWGLREGAAAALWGASGLSPEDGVSISVAYGLLVLLSSLPGAAVLIQALFEGRGRTGRPTQAGNAGTPGEEPCPGSRSD
ncbi:MAG: lysylphosphatidylglycerol synthase transmembrane domain-containing protein [Longimicrobiales bacterium]|nr:lysylphosphatidylglycerol synthase transmembrane domain-containing protein [Longimicrobiales bacterium]